MALPAYGIFEGGGAKGLAHIAGAAAAERNGLQFIGVAGASAGALVATLLAVGFKASELFDPNNPVANLLSRHQVSPLSLIGLEKWQSFEKARLQFEWAFSKKGLYFGAAMAALALGTRASIVAREVRRDGGFFSTEAIREQLNHFLRVKLQQHHANAARRVVVPDRVRFCDMSPSIVPECCTLKVVVTDITNRKMVIFDDSDEYREVEVAEAVVASISIPFVFKPARVKSYKNQMDTIYADGGMVSNLPIWVFAEEKLNYERTQMPKSKVPILAFSLIEPNEIQCDKSVSPSPFGYFSDIARSAIFGGQEVSKLFVNDLITVPMPIGLRTTQFDFSMRTAVDEYQRAYATAALSLGTAIRVKPNLARKELGKFHDEVNLLIKNTYPHVVQKILRVCIIGKFGASSFRVIQSFNMDDDADDRLVFGSSASGAPVAFRRRAPAFLDLSPQKGAAAWGYMTKYERAMLRGTLRSAISFPIFRDETAWAEPDASLRPEPVGVVSVDSDEDLEPVYKDNALLQSVVIATLPLSALLTS